MGKTHAVAKTKKSARGQKEQSVLMAEIERIGRLYGDLQPGLRKDVLELTADLRTKWLALGAKLAEVRVKHEWIAWGYSDWDDYCERELRMKRAAANAMIDAYGWMRDHHPEVVNIQAPKWLPDMRAVKELMAAERKLIYAGVDSATASDRVKEVEAKIIGGELDEMEARKAVRQIVAKPKAKKEPARDEAENRPASRTQRDEGATVPLWLAMDTVADYAGESRYNFVHALVSVVIPAAMELLGIARSRILKQLKPGEDLPGYETIDKVMADTDGRFQNLNSCIGHTLCFDPVDAKVLGSALAGVLEACDWEPEAQPSKKAPVVKKAKKVGAA